MSRQCPDCKIPLRTEEILGIALDVCPDCAGIYFDDGEMVKLKDMGDDVFSEVDDQVVPEGEPVPTERTTNRMCPACKFGMEEYAYLYTSKVRLDSCPKCHGTWVEHGELKAMESALSTARTTAENPSLLRTLDHQLEIAKELSAHEQRMARSRYVQRFMRVLLTRPPHYF